MLSLLPDEIEQNRKRILDCARINGVRNIRVFGSFARNEQTAKSDVDFLVDLEPERTGLDLGGFLMDMHDLLNRRVDVVTEQALHPKIREKVLSEAIQL